MGDNAIVSTFYKPAWGKNADQDPELLDHLTEGFFPSALPHTYFVWEIAPGQHHLIEGVSRSEAAVLAGDGAVPR
jgi:hypothetical protein